MNNVLKNKRKIDRTPWLDLMTKMKINCMRKKAPGCPAKTIPINFVRQRVFFRLNNLRGLIKVLKTAITLRMRKCNIKYYSFAGWGRLGGLKKNDITILCSAE